MVSTCCVPNCYAFQLKDRTIKFHRFPKTYMRKRKWVEAIFKDKDFEPVSSSLVCEKHFKEIDYIETSYGTKFLSNTAIPSVFWDNNKLKEKNGKCEESMSTLDENLIYDSEDANKTEYNIQEICRCCVNNKGEVNIFETEFHSIFFADLIYFCTNEKVLSCDGLPRLICQICKEQIINCFEFINKVKDNQIHIRKLLQLYSSKHQGQSEEVNFTNNPKILNSAVNGLDIGESEPKTSIQEFKQKYKGLTKVYKQLCDILLQNRSQINREGELDHNSEMYSVSLPKQNIDEKCAQFSIDMETNNNGQFTVEVENKNGKKAKSSNQCIDCSEVFYNEAEMIRHCRSTGHIMTYRYKCKLCSSTFRFRRYYKKHLKRHNETICICEICGVKVDSNIIRRHLERHNDMGPHICQICGKNYAGKGVLALHTKNQHSGKEKSLCFICGKSYRTLSLLNSHLNRKHADDDLEKKSYQCEMCPRFFISNVSLKFHKAFSHKENSVRKKRYLKINKVISGDQSRIIKQKIKYCTLCLKFVKLSDYKKHMSMHNNMKAYECKICNKQFRQVCRWKAHMKIHSNVFVPKPYKCKYCLKSFAQKFAFTTHVRLHTGERPHKCPVCGITFISLTAMKKHHQMHLRKKHKGNKKPQSKNVIPHYDGEPDSKGSINEPVDGR